MPNMKHCIFENTFFDLKQCYEALEDEGVKEIESNANMHERQFVKKLINLCSVISQEFDDKIRGDL